MNTPRHASTPAVSIIIPVFNKSDLTLQCLGALRGATKNVGYELIVVDNASSDRTAEKVRAADAGVRVLRNESNAGFAAACNQGAAAAQGKHLLFLNNDTVPLAGWLEPLVEELRSNPQVVAVGSKLLYQSGEVQHAGVAFERESRNPYHPYRFLRSDDSRVNRRRELQAVTAACILIRQNKFRECGGFHEGFRNGYEDLDLCLQLRRRGGIIVYQPRSVLFHLESQTPGRMRYDNENRALFFSRWREAVLSDDDSVYFEDGYRAQRVPGNPASAFKLARFASEAERAQWSFVAQTQRLLAAGNAAEAARRLSDLDKWPAEAAVRQWAGLLCQRLGLKEASEKYLDNALQLAAEPELRLHRALRTGAEPGDPKTEWEKLLIDGHRQLSSGDKTGARESFEAALLAGAPSRLTLPALAEASENSDKVLRRGIELLPRINGDILKAPVPAAAVREPEKRADRPTLLVNNYDFSDCSAGIRVMHYLAALLHSAGYPVAVTNPCHYNAAIPVRSDALPDDIVIYPDATRGNPQGAKRICRYMLYYAHGYFGGDRIAQNECALVYQHDYLASVQEHCDHPVTADDIITFPVLNKEWCFPETKTIGNVLYVGKGAGKPLPEIECDVIESASGCHDGGVPYKAHYAHTKTLALLRKAKRFYTMDFNTLMSCEAALCGCKVYYVKDPATFEEQTDVMEKAQAHVMSAERDLPLAKKFADKVYQFFQTAAAPQPVAAPPLVSIIVLAHNQLAETRQCVASIEQHTPEPHELILVDNGSSDGTSAFFRDYAAKHPRARVVLNRANLGFAAGNNQGLACSSGDAVLFLNNDTVVTPGWLWRMLAVLAAHPDCGVTGPVSNSVSGPQLVSPVGYSDLAGLPAFAAQRAGACNGQSAETPRLVGFCLLARRAVIDHIGGLDPQFGSGNFEDDDFCLRAGVAGFQRRIALDAFVHHIGGQTFRGAKIDYRASMLRNWTLFKAKWGLPADAPLEKGYRAPASLPAGVPLRIPLPDLRLTHAAALEERCWTDKTLPDPSAGKPTPVTLALPAAAKVGHLAPARELVNKKQLQAAWRECAALLAVRPYHPEAWLLLGEIALAAGDGQMARRCARQACELAPGWTPPKQFLKGSLRGASKPEWLQLPSSREVPSLSVCLIVRNEEKFLGHCLASIRPLASQIVVVDTGSTDRTVEIAQEHGAEVHHFTWDDDFSSARNAALERATGDWVLVLDADEEIPAAQLEVFRQEMQRPGVLGLRLPIVDAGREHEGCSHVPRLFRNAPGLFFVGRVHEQAFSSIQVRCQQWGLKHALGKAALLHHGYTREVVASRNKVERNLRLLQRALEELPGEPNLVMNLGLELARSGDLEAGLQQYWQALHLLAAKPPEEVTPELRETLLTQLTSHLMAAKCHAEVIQLWDMPFARAGGLTASQHFSLGLAYMELKQPSDAAEQMRQCIAKRDQPTLSPINAEIHKAGPQHCLAICLTALKDQPGARRAFQAALAGEASARVRLDFARFEAASGQTLDALKILNQLAAENPGEAHIWRLGGEIALSRPDYASFASDWTSEAVKRCASDKTILLQRAEALTLNQQISEAIPFWQAAPASPRQHAALVLCEILSDGGGTPIPALGESAVSREAIHWYRQWIRAGAHSVIHQLHERMETVRLQLPTFVQMWEKASRQAKAAA